MVGTRKCKRGQRLHQAAQPRQVGPDAAFNRKLHALRRQPSSPDVSIFYAAFECVHVGKHMLLVRPCLKPRTVISAYLVVSGTWHHVWTIRKKQRVRGCLKAIKVKCAPFKLLHKDKHVVQVLLARYLWGTVLDLALFHRQSNHMVVDHAEKEIHARVGKGVAHGQERWR